MTAFQIFASCFIFGALPGLVMLVRYGTKSYKLTRRVEQLAREEGQWLDFSDPETQWKILRDQNSLVTEKDSELLASAKREAVIQGRRLMKINFLWGGVMLVGALLGAAVGYQLSIYLGLPVG